MSESYCGKCCAECSFAEQLNCPGCKTGAYSPMAAQCAIATCCRSRGHERCETCTSHTYCPTLLKKDANPEAILQKLADLQRKKQAEAEAEERRQAKLRETAAVMGKWVWLIFWLMIAGSVIGLFEKVCALSVPVAVITAGLAVAGGVIYLTKLSAVDDNFRIASLRSFIGACPALLGLFVTEGTTAHTLLTLVLLIPSLVGMYYEINTFAEVLEDTDRELSKKWHKLWKTYKICMGVTFGSLVLMLLVPVLAALAILAGAIGMLIASIQEYIYLYRTAQVYRYIHNGK